MNVVALRRVDGCLWENILGQDAGAKYMKDLIGN